MTATPLMVGIAIALVVLGEGVVLVLGWALIRFYRRRLARRRSRLGSVAHQLQGPYRGKK